MEERDHFQRPQVHASVSLLFAWIVVFLCLFRGVKWLGKVVYFTTLFPCLALIVLLVRGVTLPGFEKGLIYFLSPHWSRLNDLDVWMNALLCVFYSLGIGYGALTTMASYNKFSSNCQRNVVIVGFMDVLSNVLYGMTIFSILGFMATAKEEHMDNSATMGVDLVFVALPEALARTPDVPQLFSAVYFLMLSTLCIGTQLFVVETVVTAMTEEIPKLRNHRTVTVFLFCVVAFLLGLPMTTSVGLGLSDFFHAYTVAFTIFFVALFEVLVVGVVYGYRRFTLDVKCMLGYSPCVYWTVCLLSVTPVALVALIVIHAIDVHNWRNDILEEIVSWMLLVLSMLFIPVVMLVQYCRHFNGRFLETLIHVNKSSILWGPALPENRRLRRLMDVPDCHAYYALQEFTEQQESSNALPPYSA